MKRKITIAVAALAVASIFIGAITSPYSGIAHTNLPANTSGILSWFFHRPPTAPVPPIPPVADCTSTAISKKTVQYASYPSVDPNLQSIDIYYFNRPATCPTLPIMTYVHGGGWTIGDKANSIQDKVNYFTSQGYVFISANYRLTPAVVYPAHNQDIAAALAWITTHIASYGGDPTKISLIGHSAGAMIVASLATDESYLNGVSVPRTNILCTIPLDGDGYDVTKQIVGNNSLYISVFGTDPQTDYDASSINHITTGKYIPSFFTVTRGSPGRIANAKAFADKLTSVGIYSQLLVTPTLDHEGVNAAIGAPGDTIITPTLTTFLARCR